jgi:hypothetical protein
MHLGQTGRALAALLIAAPLGAQTLPMQLSWPRLVTTALDSAHPPAATKATAYRSDALLPGNRIVAFYGNPQSMRMGILGELPPDQMMARLDTVSAAWARADTTRGVRPALHLIVTVAQADSGRDGMYRLRHGDRLIRRVSEWAASRGWLLFLDVQPGLAPIAPEVERLAQWLRLPNVHLAIDPEFTMPKGAVPGQRIGTLDAQEVNWTVRWLAELVTGEGLPPKVLVIHRFTEAMLTNHSQILADPRVQVVIDADGFGTPEQKRSIYDHVVTRRPVQFAGLKLFYKNDKPMLTPAEVVAMVPTPVYIQYQ